MREFPNLQCIGEPFKTLKDVLSLGACYDECAKIPGCKFFGSVSDITERFVNMFIKCQALGIPCEYQFGDCFLYGNDSCNDFMDSQAIIFVERQDCEEVSLEELSCFGLPWYDATKDNQDYGSSGCWIKANEDSICQIENKQCFVVDCDTNSNHLIATVRADVLMSEDYNTEENQSRIITQFLSSFDDDTACSDDQSSASYDDSTKKFTFQVDRSCFEAVSANHAINYGRSFRFEILTDETAVSGRNIFFENTNELELEFSCSISTKMFAQEAWVPKRFF